MGFWDYWEKFKNAVVSVFTEIKQGFLNMLGELDYCSGEHVADLVEENKQDKNKRLSEVVPVAGESNGKVSSSTPTPDISDILDNNCLCVNLFDKKVAPIEGIGEDGNKIVANNIGRLSSNGKNLQNLDNNNFFLFDENAAPSPYESPDKELEQLNKKKNKRICNIREVIYGASKKRNRQEDMAPPVLNNLNNGNEKDKKKIINKDNLKGKCNDVGDSNKFGLVRKFNFKDKKKDNLRSKYNNIEPNNKDQENKNNNINSVEEASNVAKQLINKDNNMDYSLFNQDTSSFKTKLDNFNKKNNILTEIIDGNANKGNDIINMAGKCKKKRITIKTF